MKERTKYFVIGDCRYILEKVDDDWYQLRFFLGDEFADIECFGSYAEAMAFILSLYEKGEHEFWTYM